MTPHWTDTGRPANLAAGLMDSLLWLQLFRQVLNQNPTLLLKRPEENRARLDECISRVQELLGEVQP